MNILRYFVRLTAGKTILWCYLIWYVVILCFYFDPSILLWRNSAGISAATGIALFLSVSKPAGSRTDHWQTFRLFLTPFCVSSFSSLIKGQGFMLIVPPKRIEQMTLLAACLCFVAVVGMVKWLFRNRLVP